MSICDGSYKRAIRTNPTTGSAECHTCGRRFDWNGLAGETKVNVPGHSPALRLDYDLAWWEEDEALEATRRAKADPRCGEGYADQC